MRRHGLGQQLLDALLERAQKEGTTQISLSVQKGSDAVAFYERNGFEAVGESGEALTMLKRLEGSAGA